MYKELSDELKMLRGVYKDLIHVHGSRYKDKLVVRIRALDSQLKDVDSSIGVNYPSGGDYNPVKEGSLKHWMKYLSNQWYRLFN